MNALAAIAAAHAVGIAPAQAVAALQEFKSVKRRMEVTGVVNGVTVYDDFAHHPTAIATTLQGLRARVKKQRIIAVIEPRSNTMKLGTHRDALANACRDADEVCWYQPDNLGWDLQPVVKLSSMPAQIFSTTADIIEHVKKTVKTGDHVVIMSNGGFDGIHSKMVDALTNT
jgi:UDP-N-acetylmuramate: L-alanyl-gamma-D-glutamyl-meso-diaminopimelate ligase